MRAFSVARYWPCNIRLQTHHEEDKEFLIVVEAFHACLGRCLFVAAGGGIRGRLTRCRGRRHESSVPLVPGYS